MRHLISHRLSSCEYAQEPSIICSSSTISLCWFLLRLILQESDPCWSILEEILVLVLRCYQRNLQKSLIILHSIHLKLVRLIILWLRPELQWNLDGIDERRFRIYLNYVKNVHLSECKVITLLILIFSWSLELTTWYYSYRFLML